MSTSVVVVPGFPPARGYSNGIVGTGPTLHVAGQIAWDEHGNIGSDDFVEQFGLALDNVLAVVTAAGGTATDIASMTMYVTDLWVYRASLRKLGPVWRARLGDHYPAMALVGVSGLVELRALVEIQAIAHLSD